MFRWNSSAEFTFDDSLSGGFFWLAGSEEQRLLFWFVYMFFTLASTLSVIIFGEAVVFLPL